MDSQSIKFYFQDKNNSQMQQLAGVIENMARENDSLKLLEVAEILKDSGQHLLAMSVNEFLILRSNLTQQVRLKQMIHLADNFISIWVSEYTPSSWSPQLLLHFAAIVRYCLDNGAYEDIRQGYYEVGMYLRNYYLATNERYYNNLAISFFEKAGDYSKAREKYRICCDISLSWGTGASISDLKNPIEKFYGSPLREPIVAVLARGFGY